MAAISWVVGLGELVFGGGDGGQDLVHPAGGGVGEEAGEEGVAFVFGEDDEVGVQAQVVGRIGGGGGRRRRGRWRW